MACKKTHYLTKREAKNHINRIQRGKRKTKCRIYKCKYCGGWHYTSWSAWAIKKFKDERKL